MHFELHGLRCERLTMDILCQSVMAALPRSGQALGVARQLLSHTELPVPFDQTETLSAWDLRAVARARFPRPRQIVHLPALSFRSSSIGVLRPLHSKNRSDQAMIRYSTLLVLASSTTVLAFPAMADKDGADTVFARLSGFQEVPAISTAAEGRFFADVAPDAITYRLEYSGLGSDVTQAHIHFGRRATNGGISVFLCSNLDDPPTEAQPCPTADGEISGTIMAADVIGPADQGIAAGEFEEVLDALALRAAYVNVHTTGHPGGEIRGQVASVRKGANNVDVEVNDSMTVQ
jgi:hypothetical protein